MGGNRSRKAPNDRPTGRASSPREVICLFLSFIHEGCFAFLLAAGPCS